MEALTRADLSFLGEASDDTSAVLVVEGRRYRLSPRALEVILDIVATLDAGEDVDVTKAKPLLSTQEAANMLGISRPTLVRLLDEGRIPFERPTGIHRRIARAAIETYLGEVGTRRAKTLSEMAETYTPGLEADGFVETR